MENLILTQLSTTDLENLIFNGIERYFQENRKDTERLPQDEVGGIDLAVQITGLAKPTIYLLAASRQIPHSKPTGKKLYFSRNELLKWIADGKRKTVSEIKSQANNF